VSTGNPDLFVICKSCGAEVSPYITECPYCGNRLRKRAPKLDRDGRVAQRRSLRVAAPSLPRLRRGEIPGIRPETRPLATATLVLAGLVGCLLWRTTLVSRYDLAVIGRPGSHWWRVVTASFVYDNVGYAFVALGSIALFGWLLENRHGPAPVLALFLLGGIGGTAATAVTYSFPVVLGANGAGLALLVAWMIPDLLALSRREEVEGDLLGAALIGVAVALMPLATSHASWISDAAGAAAGLAVGLPLAILRPV
jgi:membrane associated rhomboid family serine protease